MRLLIGLWFGPLSAVLCTATPRPPADSGAARADAPALAGPTDATSSSANAPPAEQPAIPSPGTPTIDSQDRCPDAPETVNAYHDDDGCPDVIPDDLAAVLGVVEGITFEIEKDQMRRESLLALERLAEVLARHPTAKIEIGVHAAADPYPDYGRCLTCRRAQAIRNFLITRGIEPARLIARGYGETRPIDTNKTEAGRRRNRRVELSLHP